MEKKIAKDVFTITETKAKKDLWTKIGVAYINKDNSINVILNAFPVSGKLQIRDRKPQ